MLAKQAATVDAISGGPADRRAGRGVEPAGVLRVRLRLRPSGQPLRGGAGDHRAAAARGADDASTARTTTSRTACSTRGRCATAGRRSCSAPTARGCWASGCPSWTPGTSGGASTTTASTGSPRSRPRVDAAMPEGRAVEATAAVMVTLEDGSGRLMGDHYDAKVATVTPDDLADHVRALAAIGATHLQLVLDPITAESIEASVGSRCSQRPGPADDRCFQRGWMSPWPTTRSSRTASAPRWPASRASPR